MNRKKRRKKYVSCFVFTPEIIRIAEEALTLFDQPLQRADHQDAMITFAEETMKQVKSKLETMKKSVGVLCLTMFDYNEKIILTQAIRLYSLHLLSLPSNAQHTKKLQRCQQIIVYFAMPSPKA